jgi:CheY-like chemotaxis protein
MPVILVIDDEATLSTMLAQALRRFGYDVEIALDGLAGIRKFENRYFDLVITDIRMQGVDGYGVLKAIRASDRPTTPVIAMSGTAWELEESVFDAVLQKPFPLRTLQHSVRQFIDGMPMAANVG